MSPRFSSTHQPSPEDRYRVPAHRESHEQREASKQAERETREAAETDFQDTPPAPGSPATEGAAIPPDSVMTETAARNARVAAQEAAGMAKLEADKAALIAKEEREAQAAAEPIFDLTPAALEALATQAPTRTVAEARAQMDALAAEIKKLETAEREAATQARAAAQKIATRQAQQSLAPIRARLVKQVEAAQAVMATHSRALRAMASSCAGDNDSGIRRQVSALNAQAGPLLQQLVEITKTAARALKEVDWAIAYPDDWRIEAATKVAQEALEARPGLLEIEAESLFAKKLDLRGGISGQTRGLSGHVDPHDSITTRADFGGSILS